MHIKTQTCNAHTQTQDLELVARLVLPMDLAGESLEEVDKGPMMAMQAMKKTIKATMIAMRPESHEETHKCYDDSSYGGQKAMIIP
jgi:tRNA G37 N-methylase TrmD